MKERNHVIGDDIGIHFSVTYKQPITYSADAVISIKYRQGTGICQKLPEWNRYKSAAQNQANLSQLTWIRQKCILKTTVALEGD